MTAARLRRRNVLAAAVESLEVRKLLSASDLDPGFSGDGIVYGPDLTMGRDVAVQGDGKVLVLYEPRTAAGGVFLQGDIKVARYKTDGTIDGTFGDGGVATVDFGSTPALGGTLLVQSDGKILIGGVLRNEVGGNVNDDFLVARLTSGGQLDNSFSGDGKFTLDAPVSASDDDDFVTDLLQMPDGKIVAAGSSAAFRLTAGGVLDSSFDQDGIRRFDDLGTFSYLALAANNKVVIAGGGGNTVLRRLMPDGSTDPNFNSGRRVIIYDYYVKDAVVTAGDKVLLVGSSAAGEATFRRYSSAGWRDDNFGTQGVKGFNLGGGDLNGELVQQPDGKLLFATSGGPGGDIVVARFTASVDPDASFAPGGTTRVEVEGRGYFAGLAFSPTGEIVVGAETYLPSLDDPTNFRYLALRLVGDASTPTPNDFAVISNGVLTVTGTSNADTITINPSGGNAVVSLNGATRSFALSSFTSILVNADGGNDNVTIAGTITKPAKLLGGGGNDSLVGGGGADTLDGQAGADTMKGGSGSDTVDYSFRTTNVAVGPGTAADDGEANEHDNVWFDVETLIGGSGNDNFSARPQDVINNLFVGNGGEDWLKAGAGNDTLEGGPGSDTLDGGDGNDTAVNPTGDILISIENGGGGGGGGPIVENPDGSITVNGTANADSVEVSNDGEITTIVLNGVSHEFSNNGDHRRLVIVHAGGGNDTLRGNDNAVVVFHGEGGNDTFFLDELLQSTVFGGEGNDYFEYSGAHEPGPDDDGGAGTDTAGVFGFNGSLDTSISFGGSKSIENMRVGGDITEVIGNELGNRIEIRSDMPVTVRGGGGNDTIIGGEGANLLLGEGGNDSIEGGDGDDTIDGGTGGDTIKGGGGNDTADYSWRTANLTIGLGTAADDGELNEKDNVATDIETVLGGSGNDTISAANAGTKANLLVGNGGNDSLFGGDGNDTLSGDGGGDTLNGGNGTDTATYATGDTLISIEVNGGEAGAPNTVVITADRTLLVTGTGNADTVTSLVDNFDEEIDINLNGATTTFAWADFDRVVYNVGGGGDTVTLDQLSNMSGNPLQKPQAINAGEGNDQIFFLVGTGANVNGEGGDDSVIADDDSFNPFFDGGSGTDSYENQNPDNQSLDMSAIMPGVENAEIYWGLLIGNDLNNRLETPGGSGTIRGNGGNDTLLGSDDVDSLEGGAGDDVLDGKGGGDVMKGGDGNDTVTYASRNTGVKVGIGTLADDGDAGDGQGDNVYLDIETVIGGSGNDTITGGAANNLIVGNGGNDSLRGNYGDDTLVGGAGTDTLNGENGSDTAQDAAGDILISIENS